MGINKESLVPGPLEFAQSGLSPSRKRLGRIGGEFTLRLNLLLDGLGLRQLSALESQVQVIGDACDETSGMIGIIAELQGFPDHVHADHETEVPDRICEYDADDGAILIEDWTTRGSFLKVGGDLKHSGIPAGMFGPAMRDGSLLLVVMSLGKAQGHDPLSDALPAGIGVRITPGRMHPVRLETG